MQSRTENIVGCSKLYGFHGDFCKVLICSKLYGFHGDIFDIFVRC